MQNYNPYSNPFFGKEPNPWLLDYIHKNRATKSRYDIDLYLLQRGYDPNEIAAAWHLLDTMPQAKSSNDLWKVWVAIAVVLVCIAVMVIMIQTTLPHHPIMSYRIHR